MSIELLPELIKLCEIVSSSSSPWALLKSNFSIVGSAVCTTIGALVLKYIFKYSSCSMYFMHFFSLPSPELPSCLSSTGPVAEPSLFGSWKLWFDLAGLQCSDRLILRRQTASFQFLVPSSCLSCLAIFWSPGLSVQQTDLADFFWWIWACMQHVCIQFAFIFDPNSSFFREKLLKNMGWIAIWVECEQLALRCGLTMPAISGVSFPWGATRQGLLPVGYWSGD